MSNDSRNEHVAHAVAAEPLGDAVAAPSRVRITGGISDAQLRLLLGLPETQERILEIVAHRVRAETPRATIDDIAQEANVSALLSKSRPRSMDTASGWLAVVTARAVAMHFRRNAVHAKWLRRDVEVEELAGEPGDGLEPRWSVSRWLAALVADHPRDQETYELLRYKAQTGKSHEEIAAEHAMTTAALKNRIHKFKATYEPQWRKRERTFLFLLLLLGVAAVAVGVVAARLFMRPRSPILGPDVYPAAPKPTVTASPPPFEPAQPTGPRNDKPPAP